MRVTVRDDGGAFNQQTHAYAEYRAFARLAARPLHLAGVTITLTRARAGEDNEVRCAIEATLESGEVVAASAVGRYAYAAVDRAVDLIGQARAIEVASAAS